MKTRIYLDNAATTKTSKEVVDAMLPYLQRITEILPVFTKLDREVKRLLQRPCEQIAQVIGAKRKKFILPQAAVKSEQSGR